MRSSHKFVVLLLFIHGFLLISCRGDEASPKDIQQLEHEMGMKSEKNIVTIEVDGHTHSLPHLESMASMPGPSPNLVEKIIFKSQHDPDFIHFKSIQPYLDYADEFGDLVHYTLSKGGDFVLVSSADELQTVYESNAYHKRPFAPYFGYTYGILLGKEDHSLVNAVSNGFGPDWYRYRHIVDGLLKKYVPLQMGDFNSHAREIVKLIRKNGLNNHHYRPYEDMFKAQVRLQGRQTYGKFFTEEVASQFDDAIESWIDSLPKFLPFDFTPGKGWPLIAGLFRLGLEKHLKTVGEFQRKVLAHKRATGDYGDDWMGRLATTPGPDGKLLNDDEIQAISFDVFVLGSSGPSPIFLEYGFYLLGTHKEWQTKLRDSLKDWSPDRDVTMQDLMSNPVLHNVFREMMRSYPPGGGINGRSTTEHTILGHYLIPNNTQIMINAWRIHHDPRYWTHPSTFDPERFNEARNEPSHPGAFSPFGGGKRRCPGYSHATLDLMVAVMHIYKQFDVTYPDSSPPEMQFQVTARPKKHFPIVFREVSK